MVYRDIKGSGAVYRKYRLIRNSKDGKSAEEAIDELEPGHTSRLENYEAKMNVFGVSCIRAGCVTACIEQSEGSILIKIPEFVKYITSDFLDILSGMYAGIKLKIAGGRGLQVLIDIGSNEKSVKQHGMWFAMSVSLDSELANEIFYDIIEANSYTNITMDVKSVYANDRIISKQSRLAYKLSMVTKMDGSFVSAEALDTARKNIAGEEMAVECKRSCCMITGCVGEMHSKCESIEQVEKDSRILQAAETELACYCDVIKSSLFDNNPIGMRMHGYLLSDSEIMELNEGAYGAELIERVLSHTEFDAHYIERKSAVLRYIGSIEIRHKEGSKGSKTECLSVLAGTDGVYVRSEVKSSGRGAYTTACMADTENTDRFSLAFRIMEYMTGMYRKMEYICV